MDKAEKIAFSFVTEPVNSTYNQEEEWNLSLSIKKLEMGEKRNYFNVAIEHYSSKPKELVLWTKFSKNTPRFLIRARITRKL